MSTGPKKRTKVKAGALARARKPSGRINKEDLKNAQALIKLYNKKALLKELDRSAKGKKAIREYMKRQGATEAQIKRQLNPYRKEAMKNLSFQTKGIGKLSGPAGKVMKKKKK